MTGFFVVLMGNGRLSQKINHYFEAHTNGRGFFQSLKPSAINFPLRVQWIDRGHWTHRSFTRGPISSAPQRVRQFVNPEPHVKFPNFIVSRHRTAFPTRSEHDTFAPRTRFRTRRPGTAIWLRGAWHQYVKGAICRPCCSMRPFRKLVCIGLNSVGKSSDAGKIKATKKIHCAWAPLALGY